MIRLEDRSQVSHDNAWVKRAEVRAFRIVENSYVAYDLQISTTLGTKLQFWRRYAEFDRLRAQLLIELPEEYLSIPQLPPKSSTSGLENALFLETRQDGLDYFAKCIFMNPLVAHAHALKDFIR